MSKTSPPAGYRESALGGTVLVARDDVHDALKTAASQETLHRWAARQTGARAMQGRGVAWATALEGGPRVVVRHSRHGGMLAGLTGDLFLAPSRAPHELQTAVTLRAAGVPTPDVVAYATYAAIGPFCRADVVTALIDGADLPAAWAGAHTPAARDAIVDAVAALLRRLQAAHARHPDLNVKNILIADADGMPAAWVLDVDRVDFLTHLSPTVTGRNNARRLLMSLEKWRRLRGLDFGPAHVDRLFDCAGVIHHDPAGPEGR